VPEIEKEVNKLIESGFIHEGKYLIWIANIVLLRRKMGNSAFAWTFGISMTLVQKMIFHYQLWSS